jgi:GH25 family lysozyme M1 (1,4-beta-N-acetylmuramidase)
MNAVEWVDVSYVQGYPNYLQLKSDGIYGAIARVNEGTIEDGSLAWNWPRISAAGLVRGGYDFAYTANTAAFEAAQFLAYLQAVGGWTANDILVLDIEQNAGNLSAGALQQWALAWCSTVMVATGIRPWVYSYLSFISQYLQNSALTAYPLWLAEPSATSWPAAPAPWTSIVAWQYGAGSLNGVSGSVDLDEVAVVPPPPVPMYNEDEMPHYYENPAGTAAVLVDGEVLLGMAIPWDVSAAKVAGYPGMICSDALYATLAPSFAAAFAASTLATAAEVAKVDADVKALPAPATSGLTATQASQLADADAKAADADAEIAQVDADIKALPAPATPGEVLAVEGRVEGVEADVLAGDAAIENVINARGKTKP